MSNPTDGISKCRSCNKDVDVALNIEYAEPFPPMLVIQLNRVRYDPEIQNITKLNYNIQNYNNLNING